MSIGLREPVVLASSSGARRRLLEAAGIAVAVDPAAIDEAAIKAAFRRADSSAERCAGALAEAKAVAVGRRHADVLVIGADQTLDCDGTWLDKPRDAAEARRQLAFLGGRTHVLHSAVAVIRDGIVLWQLVERARLVMRRFSDAFLDGYIAAMGERVGEMVGGYALEGLGAQLFERIEGDYFTILGLPLLPLLEFLRRQGALAS